MWSPRSALLLLGVLLGVARADMQMLGLGGGGGGGMVKGSSFNLDTKERITRVHGAGVKLDLELLEVAAAGGSLLYTPTHVEYKKGLTRWMQTYSDGKISMHHNDKTVLQLYAPDESPYYLLSMRQGNAAFRDLILDKALSNAVAFTLCIVDSVFDESLTQAACEVRAESMHMTVSQSMEGLAKSLLYVSEFVSSAQKNILSDIITSVQSSLVSPLQAEVSTTLGEVRTEVSELHQSLRSEHDSLAENLRASEEAMNTTLSTLIGEVAHATTVTLNSISTEAHNNLTKLEKAVFLHFLEFNNTYGQLLDVTVLQLQNNLTRLANEVLDSLEVVNTSTLPALHERIINETNTLLASSLSRLEKESNWNITRYFDVAMNFTRLLRQNLSTELLSMNEKIDSRINESEAKFMLETNKTSEKLIELRDEVAAKSAIVNESLELLGGNFRQVMDSVILVSQNSSSNIKQLNDSLQEFSINIEKNMSDLRNESNSQSLVMRNDLEGEIFELHSETFQNITVLFDGLKHAGDLLKQLEQNTSHGLARSNSILAQAVGDVNQSLTMLGTAAGASFSRLESNLSASVENILSIVNSTALHLSNNSHTDLLQTRRDLTVLLKHTAGNISSNLQELNMSTMEQLEDLSNALREEAKQLEVRQLQALDAMTQESETNLTNSIMVMNSTIKNDINALNVTVSERIIDLNTSAEMSFANLTSNVTNMFAFLQRLVVDLAREVYSPLEIDNLHPDNQPSSITVAGDDDQFQRKRSKKKEKAAPVPQHFLHEELRVDVVGDLLDLLDHEHGRSRSGDVGKTLSRSAVIEKGLQKLQYALRHQRQDIDELINTTVDTWSNSLHEGLKQGNDNLIALANTTNSTISLLNNSFLMAKEDSNLIHEQLNSSLTSLNLTLKSALQGEVELLHLNLSTIQSNSEQEMKGLRDAIRGLWHETFQNASQSYNILDANLNQTNLNLAASAAKSELALENLSATSTEALLALRISTNHSVDILSSLLNQKAEALERQIFENSTNLVRGVHDLNASFWVEELKTRQQIDAMGESLNAAQKSATNDLLATEVRLQTEGKELHTAIAKNISELKHSVVSAFQHYNSSQADIMRSVANLSLEHTTWVNEQASQWVAHSLSLENVAVESNQGLVALNDSLVANLASSTSAMRAALRLVNDTQSTMTTQNHQSLVDMVEKSASNASDAVAAVAQETSIQIQGINTYITDLSRVTSDNISRVEASLSSMIAITKSDVISNCSSELLSTSSSLSKTLESAKDNFENIMSSLSAEVNSTLHSSMRASSQQLQLFEKSVSGQINFTSHRINTVEARVEKGAALTDDLRKDLFSVSSNMSRTQQLMEILAEGHKEQSSRIWELANSSSVSSTAVNHLSALAASSTENVRELQNSVRSLEANTSRLSGLLEGALLFAKDSTASIDQVQKDTAAKVDSLAEQSVKNQAAISSFRTQLGGEDSSFPSLQHDVSRLESNLALTNTAVNGIESSLTALKLTEQESHLRTDRLDKSLAEVSNVRLPAISAEIAEVSAKSEKGLEKLSDKHEQTFLKSMAVSDEKVAKLEQRMAVVELLVEQQDRRIDALVRENEALKRSTAAQESVDELRKLLQDLQASMISQSSKVLDLIVTNLAGGNK